MHIFNGTMKSGNHFVSLQFFSDQSSVFNKILQLHDILIINIWIIWIILNSTTKTSFIHKFKNKIFCICIPIYLVKQLACLQMVPVTNPHNIFSHVFYSNSHNTMNHESILRNPHSILSHLFKQGNSHFLTHWVLYLLQQTHILSHLFTQTNSSNIICQVMYLLQ